MSGEADGDTFDKISHPNGANNHSSTSPQNPKIPILTYRQIACLVLMIFFSTYGMVSIEDIAFVVFSIVYTIFLSKFVFPSLDSPLVSPMLRKSRLLRLYVLLTLFVGMIFPITFISEGLVGGDRERVEAAVPHLFLVASQVFMEGFAFYNQFSLPVFTFVPISYNTKRIFTIIDWLRSEITRVNDKSGSPLKSSIGQWLAIANLILWSYNLFGFLLPIFLPMVFKRYYGHKAKD